MLRKAAVFTLAAIAILGLARGPAIAATTALEPKDAHWGFEGPFGTFDTEQLQRGFKVYHDVCSACHSMNLLHYYDLGIPGGPFFDEKYPKPIDNPRVKAIAAEVKVPDVDQDTGDPIQRPATPADTFRAPFPNDAAARASNGGALPPDLSLIVKARDGGARYIYSILTGYKDPPTGLTVPPGKAYNPYFPGDLTSYWSGPKDQVPPGGFISMPFQLTADRVSFDDGMHASTPEEAWDVVAFLAWASEPHQVERKQMGFSVMIYLLILAGIVYASYRRIWRRVGH
jgi:ubiquinol-cytochrome c reductase cytochrome c1 subunit